MQKAKLTLPINRQKIKELALPLEMAVGKMLGHLARLSPRERVIVAAGAVFVAVFILLAGIIGPLLHYQTRLDAMIASKDGQLRKVYAMSASIKGLQAAAEKGAGMEDSRVTLFGFLEELAARLSINDRIEYMKPITDSTEAGHESVELKIKGLSQDDLVSLLFGIESTPYPLKIKHVIIRRQEKEGAVDLTLQVVSYG